MGAFECVSASEIIPTDNTGVFTISVSSNTTLNETKNDVESQSLKRRGCVRSRSLWWTLGVDLPLLLIIAALVGLFELGVIPNHKSGFYCNDPGLSYPNIGETVGSATLMLTVIFIPIIIALPTEYIFTDSELTTGKKLRQSFRNTCYLYRTYILGFVINLGVVEVMKGIVGSPRPVFFAMCKPDAAATCNGSEFVSSFECTSSEYSRWYLMDSYRSFPSGHAALSVYCGFFTAWYLQKRAFDWNHSSVALVPVLQLLSVCYSAVCSLTRVTDHRHHWWDVLAGAVIGLVAVYYAAVALSDNFSYYTSKKSTNLKSEESRQTVRTYLYDNRQEPVSP